MGNALSRGVEGSLSIQLERHEFDAGEVIDGTVVLRVVKPIKCYGKRVDLANTFVLKTSGLTHALLSTAGLMLELKGLEHVGWQEQHGKIHTRHEFNALKTTRHVL